MTRDLCLLVALTFVFFRPPLLTQDAAAPDTAERTRQNKENLKRGVEPSRGSAPKKDIHLDPNWRSNGKPKQPAVEKRAQGHFERSRRTEHDEDEAHDHDACNDPKTPATEKLKNCRSAPHQ